VLHASDVPAGVVNILTGLREELTEHFASHMDVNAIVWCDGGGKTAGSIQKVAAENVKRVVRRTRIDWSKADAQHPYLIRDTQEVKTTWHPIGA
jgi:LmbE family N-acetylglucosaminyl deacetylase